MLRGFGTVSMQDIRVKEKKVYICLFIDAAATVTKECQIVGVFFLISSEKAIPSLHFQTSWGPHESLCQNIYFTIRGTASSALRQQKATIVAGEMQIDWCIGELKLPRHVIIPATVWKLSDHRDTSHRWLTVPSSSHITAVCQTIQLCSSLLSNRLLFTSLQSVHCCM